MGSTCERDSFVTRHTFTADVAEANGDSGTYTGGDKSSKIKMVWTAGAAAGAVFRGQWHRGVRTYTGHYAHAGHSVAATLVPGETGCAVVTTTAQHSSIIFGQTESDTATVTGTNGIAPQGDVTFYVCGPGVAVPCTTATGTELGTSVPVGGSGGATATATSTAFQPPAVGTYCFAVAYGADPGYAAIVVDSGECFTVVTYPPGLTLTQASSNIALGRSNTDTATVTGLSTVTPTGTVDFLLCPNDVHPCTANSPAVLDLGTVALSGSGASATADIDLSPAATGTYCSSASYSGSDIYAPATDEPLTADCFIVAPDTAKVTTAPTSPSIVLGDSDSDTALVTGQDNVTPTGTVDFTVCSGDSDPCTSTSSGAVDLGAAALAGTDGSATAASTSFTPTATGTYCFSGAYSGDTTYTSGADNATADECFIVTPVTPTVTTAPASSTIVLGTSDDDTATVTGVAGVTPTGTVDFTICPGDADPCTSSSSGAVDLGAGQGSGSGATATSVSPGYTPTATGSYCFSGTYSGDANYTSATDNSTADECFTVIAAPQPPIALGSPENSYGTGTGPGGTPATGVWAAVNGYCTAEENGDQYLSAFDGLWNGSAWVCPNQSPPPSTTVAKQYVNPEYNGDDGTTAGYSYDITPPPSSSDTLTSPLEVDVYDPAYEPVGCPDSPDEAIGDPVSGGTASTITTIYSLYSHPVPGDDSFDVSRGTPVAEPTSAPGTCATWVPMFTIPAGSPDGQYRLQVTTLAGQADSSGINAYGVRVWSTGSGSSWTRCSTISSVAWFSGVCPQIAGESALSAWVSAGSTGNVATFYLASIGAQDAGQTMNINLFDPGEGSKYMQILDPNGCPVPFTLQATDNATRVPQGFPSIAPTGESSDASVSTSTESAACLSSEPTPVDNPGLDVSGTLGANNPPDIRDNYIYNDRDLQLSVAIPANYTATNGGWWSIRYIATGVVTDRTMWSVTVRQTAAGSRKAARSGSSHHGGAAGKHHQKRLSSSR
jgi:hypothetical protein